MSHPLRRGGVGEEEEELDEEELLLQHSGRCSATQLELVSVRSVRLIYF